MKRLTLKGKIFNNNDKNDRKMTENLNGTAILKL